MIAVNEPCKYRTPQKNQLHFSAMFAMLSFPQLHIKMGLKSMHSSFSWSAFTVNHLFIW